MNEAVSYSDPWASAGRAESGAASLAGVLQRQHARIARLMSHVLVSGSQAASPLRALSRYVALHEAAEQSFLHPAALAGAAASPDPAHLDGVQSRLDEEGEISACIDRLSLLVHGSADFMIQLGLLEEAVLGHCRAEEQGELATLSRVASQEDLDRIAQGMDFVDEWYELLDTTGQGAAPTYAELHRRCLNAFGSVSRIL